MVVCMDMGDGDYVDLIMVTQFKLMVGEGRWDSISRHASRV